MGKHPNAGAKAASLLTKGNKEHTDADNASTAVHSNTALIQGRFIFISRSECYVISHGCTQHCLSNDPPYSKGTKRTAGELGNTLGLWSCGSLMLRLSSHSGCYSINAILKEKPKWMDIFKTNSAVMQIDVFGWMSVMPTAMPVLDTGTCCPSPSTRCHPSQCSGKPPRNYKDSLVRHGEEETFVRGESLGDRKASFIFMGRWTAKILCLKATSVRLHWVPNAFPSWLFHPWLCNTCLELGQEEMGAEHTHGSVPAPFSQGWTYSCGWGF